jgi:hypothetical protein
MHSVNEDGESKGTCEKSKQAMYSSKEEKKLNSDVPLVK